MSVRINTNIEAMNAQRNLSITASAFSKSVEKLSSGLRINRAADDAAGLAISQKLDAQVRGLNQAQRNAQDGISLVQTAEGALNESHSILQRMRELVVQAGTATVSDEDKTSIQSEIDSLNSELDRIANTSAFNGTNLLDGTLDGQLLVGANGGADDFIGVAVATAMDSTGLVTSAVDVTANTATVDLASIDKAIKSVSDTRAGLGAIQNRLEHTIASLGVASENMSASESRIKDLDVASEMVNFTKTQILQQAGTAILAQANQAPQNILTLLR